jgi:hypothetical protein
LYLRALIICQTARYPVRIVDEIVDPWYPIDATKVRVLYANREGIQ